MNDKIQKIKFIEGTYCDTINNLYLSQGWRVVEIYPASSKERIGAYVLIEKTGEELTIAQQTTTESDVNDLCKALGQIGINIYDESGTLKSTSQVLNTIADYWSN